MSSDKATLGFRLLTDSRLPRRLMGILEEPGMVATLVEGARRRQLHVPSLVVPGDSSDDTGHGDDGIVGGRR